MAFPDSVHKGDSAWDLSGLPQAAQGGGGMGACWEAHRPVSHTPARANQEVALPASRQTGPVIDWLRNLRAQRPNLYIVSAIDN